MNKGHQIPVRVRRAAFGNQYRCLIEPKTKPSILIPLLHVTQAYFKDAASRDGGKITLYRMGGEQAIEILHKDLPWVERMEREVLSRIQEVATWMNDESSASTG